jgi:hypothetical protein
MTGICCCIASRSKRLSAEFGVSAHELAIDDIITRVDLAMSFTLIVIPDPSAPSREYGLDAQQVCHLPRLEDPAPRVDQRNALAAELEPTPASSDPTCKARRADMGQPLRVEPSTLRDMRKSTAFQ